MEEHMAHMLRLEERERLTVTGVSEVVHFEEGTVALRTGLGTLVVQGRELKLKQLTPEGGQVTVQGRISALGYEEPRSAQGWLRGLIR